MPYNLTDGQKDLLRKIVEEVRAGNLPEEFWVYWVEEVPEGVFGEYEGEHPPPVTRGALDALAASDLILSEPSYGQHQESSRRCTLLGNAYTAVDSDFGSRGHNTLNQGPFPSDPWPSSHMTPEISLTLHTHLLLCSKSGIVLSGMLSSHSALGIVSGKVSSAV